MFDTALEITDFHFYNMSSRYGFEMPLGDDTTLEATIEFKTIQGCEYVDYIEVVSDHDLTDVEQEDIELLLQDNINDIFETAQIL